MATDNTLHHVYRFQKKIAKYVALGENEKLLYCIHKLKYLPVTVQHLEITSVGKSINSLRHEPGDIGEKARVLVGKWKQMVSEEEQEEQQRDIVKNQKDNDHHRKTNSHLKEAPRESQMEDSDENNSLHIEEKEDYNTPKEQSRNCKIEENGYDPKTSREDYLSMGNNSPYKPTSSGKYYSLSPNHGDEISNGNVKKEEGKHKKKHHKSKSSSKHETSSSSSTHRSKREKSEMEGKHESKNKAKKRHKFRNSSENLSNFLAENVQDRLNHNSDTRLPHLDLCRQEKRSNLPNSSRNELQNSEEALNRESEPRISKNRSQKSSSAFEAALMGFDIPSKKKKKKKDRDEKREKVNPGESTYKDLKTERNDASSVTTYKRIESPVYEMEDPILPDLSDDSDDFEEPKLMADYKPLPQVPQRNRTVLDTFHNRMMDEEALGVMLSSRTQTKNRKLYTGKASIGMTLVPSLFNSCIKVLQENIAIIETFGGIPYEILKPILEKAQPNQLFSLEDYNPYLLDDSDELWASHCRKSFKYKVREDMETWREMFIRCTDEHDVKMRNITDILQRKKLSKVPAKKTLPLSLISGIAKTPKSLVKAQVVQQATGVTATGSKPISAKNEESTSSSKLLNNQHPKPDRQSSQARPPAAKKPKLAPLMAKSRQMMKKVCYKR